jgi:DNA-binding SARP family transcriptional activator
VSAGRLIADLWGETPPETAQNVIQTYVSQLRKALGAAAIVSRPHGYALELEEGQLDLHRFERLVERGGEELAAGRAAEAAATLREALAMWRGPALADFAYEPFAQPEIGRLEELRLVALERRLEADLACGRHAEAVGQLEALIAEHPLRERLRGQLMLALYRSGRQAEALEAYQEARRALVDELGIDPSPALQELEKAILRQDPALAAPGGEPRRQPEPSLPEPSPARSVLVLVGRQESLDALLAVAVPLAHRPPRELILARLLAVGESPGEATEALARQREALAPEGVSSRVAAFTSESPADDAVLLATEQDVDLLLTDAPDSLLQDGQLAGSLAEVLSAAPCDVGVLVAQGGGAAEAPVLVPFGGVDHDWAAIELAAWIARSRSVSLKLLGAAADKRRERRDASRLLARASLVVQQAAGVVAEPELVRPGAAGVLEASRAAGLLVLGLSDRWPEEGLGAVRLAVAQGSPVPVLFVRRGLRPGGLAPPHTLTRFTWTLAASEG